MVGSHEIQAIQGYQLWLHALTVRRSGQPVIHRQDAITPSAYQQSLDAGTTAPPLSTSTVKYWSDFSRVYYHPKSIVQLNDFELNSTIMPFEKWHTGEDLFANLDKEHDILDRDLRPFAEESDQMQGLQIITGLDDAWAGFSTNYVERLRDEYGKIPIWIWGVQEPANGLSRVRSSSGHSLDSVHADEDI